MFDLFFSFPLCLILIKLIKFPSCVCVTGLHSSDLVCRINSPKVSSWHCETEEKCKCKSIGVFLFFQEMMCVTIYCFVKQLANWWIIILMINASFDRKSWVLSPNKESLVINAIRSSAGCQVDRTRLVSPAAKRMRNQKWWSWINMAPRFLPPPYQVGKGKWAD